MTEGEAQSWLTDHLGVSRETMAALEEFVEFVRREASSQNLIASSTIDSIWARHVVDSAQLLSHLPQTADVMSWLDLGSGAGFPGIIIALLTQHPVTLVESRSRRIDYLQRAIAMLDLENHVKVAGMPLERLQTAPYSVISARAFAPLPRLFALAARFSTDKTLWLLPKGRNAAKEWGDVQPEWTGDFRIERSITDNGAGILVGHLTGMPENSAVPAAKRQQKR
jgi:16S rRNA (guanine527-N7)-methyltransferase